MRTTPLTADEQERREHLLQLRKSSKLSVAAFAEIIGQRYQFVVSRERRPSRTQQPVAWTAAQAHEAALKLREHFQGVGGYGRELIKAFFKP